MRTFYKGVNLVTDKKISEFVKKYYPRWKWRWTTVDNYGFPQIILIMKKEWKLLTQEEIK